MVEMPGWRDECKRVEAAFIAFCLRLQAAKGIALALNLKAAQATVQHGNIHAGASITDGKLLHDQGLWVVRVRRAERRQESFRMS